MIRMTKDSKKKKIVISLSEDELEAVKKYSKCKGQNISVLTKKALLSNSQVSSDNDLGRAMHEIETSIKTIKMGTVFSLKSLMGLTWDNYSQAVKLNAGKTLRRICDNHTFEHAKFHHKDLSKTKWFIKITE